MTKPEDRLTAAARRAKERLANMSDEECRAHWGRLVEFVDSDSPAEEVTAETVAAIFGNDEEAVDSIVAANMPTGTTKTVLSPRSSPACTPRAPHLYVSTACTHERHDECRRVCKFCPATCLCTCHEERR